MGTKSFWWEPITSLCKRTLFVNFEGKVLTEKDVHVMPDSAEKSFNSEIAQGSFPSTESLFFLNPDTFRAGQIHTRIIQWERILANSPQKEEILD